MSVMLVRVQRALSGSHARDTGSQWKAAACTQNTNRPMLSAPSQLNNLIGFQLLFELFAVPSLSRASRCLIQDIVRE